MKKIAVFCFLLMNAFLAQGQSALYNKALLYSQLLYDAENSEGECYSSCFIRKLALSDDGTILAAVFENGIKVYDTSTGSLINSFERHEKLVSYGSKVNFAMHASITSNRYLFVLYCGGYGHMIDLLTRREAVFETPASGENDWNYMWMAFKIPGDSILIVNRLQKGSWHIGLNSMKTKYSTWHYKVYDVSKNLFLNRRMKNNEPADSDPMEVREYPSGKLIRTLPGAYITSKISPDGSKVLKIQFRGFSVIDIKTGDTLMADSGHRFVDNGSKWVTDDIIAYTHFDPITYSGIDLFRVSSGERLGQIDPSEVAGTCFDAGDKYLATFGGIKDYSYNMLYWSLSVFDMTILTEERNFFLDAINFLRANWEERNRPPEMKMKVFSPGTLATDFDDNTYKTVIINGHTYMAENLKTTRFSNGDLIPLIREDDRWKDAKTPAMCNCDNNEGNLITYGYLYNGYAVSDKRNICPTGWHVIKDSEYESLFAFLGGEYNAPVRLKTAGIVRDGTGLWHGYNFGATNNSGFSAVPSGCRTEKGIFNMAGSGAYFWTGNLDFWLLDPENSHLIISYIPVNTGLSVRCMKNE